MGKDQLSFRSGWAGDWRPLRSRGGQGNGSPGDKPLIDGSQG